MEAPHIFTHSESGLTVLHRKHYSSEIIHCGFIINTGARDENEVNNGITHFIEHAVFKGTNTKTANQILNFIEQYGGEINAFTTREKTCYYISCLKQYVGKAIHLLVDLVFNASFPDKELVKEKNVIYEEIDMYYDTPDESIYDDFYQALFKGHSLGYNILGTRETLEKMNGDDCKAYLNKQYTSQTMALSVVGNLSINELEGILDRSIHQKIRSEKPIQRISPKKVNPTKEQTPRDFSQNHTIIGTYAYPKTDERRFVLSLLNAYLGGGGMSSKLNVSVRERHGLTYQISSNYATYQDSGTFTIYFACDKKNQRKCETLIYKELEQVINKPIPETALQKIKNQAITQLGMLQENPSLIMQNQARNWLDYHKTFSFKEIEEKIKRISSAQIQEIAKDSIALDSLFQITYLTD